MMDKQKLPKPGNRKRSKKLTLTEAVSEPKKVKLDSLSTPPNLHSPASKKLKVKNGKPNAKSAKISKLAILPLTEAINTDSVNNEENKIDNVIAKSDNVESKIDNALPNQVVKSKRNKKKKVINAFITQPLNSVPVTTSPKNKKKKHMETVSASVVPESPKNPEKPATMTEDDLQKNLLSKLTNKEMTLEEVETKFSILNNKELIEKFTNIPISNNQKGRIRQAIKLSLEGTPKAMVPEIINGKINAMMKNTVDLTDSDLRRIRILYNMLKSSIAAIGESDEENNSPKKKKSPKKKNKNKESELNGVDKKESERPVDKVKGPKRYVVFLGNLPLNVDKEMIMDHFKELNEHIKDIRLPKVAEGIKSAIGYVELSNEPSYELALSKHHSMLGNKRIRVLYTTQQNSKISKSEAKSKSAKLIALRQSGKLIGSIAPSKKRSHRRAIMKQAKAKEAAENAS